MVYTAEKLLNENGDKIPDAMKDELKTKIEAVKSTLNGTDYAAMKARSEELNQAVQKIGASMYQQQQGPDAAGGAGSNPEGGPSASGNPPPRSDRFCAR